MKDKSMAKSQGLVAWIDSRFPMTSLIKEHLTEYYAPKNFNFWYYFGSLALLILVNQILTGIWLTMNYTPTAEGAFAEQYGWYSSIYAIAQGDLTKFDQVTKLNIHSCFTFLSFEKQKIEIESNKIKNAR